MRPVLDGRLVVGGRSGRPARSGRVLRSGRLGRWERPAGGPSARSACSARPRPGLLGRFGGSPPSAPGRRGGRPGRSERSSRPARSRPPLRGLSDRSPRWLLSDRVRPGPAARPGRSPRSGQSRGDLSARSVRSPCTPVVRTGRRGRSRRSSLERRAGAAPLVRIGCGRDWRSFRIAAISSSVRRRHAPDGRSPSCSGPRLVRTRFSTG